MSVAPPLYGWGRIRQPIYSLSGTLLEPPNYARSYCWHFGLQLVVYSVNCISMYGLIFGLCFLLLNIILEFVKCMRIIKYYGLKK